MPDFIFQPYYLPQTPDSIGSIALNKSVENLHKDTIKKATPIFSFQNKVQDSIQKKSIMSSDFQTNKLDSLMKAKRTIECRHKRRKKNIKSHKIIDSPILVQKDSFLFLQNAQNAPLNLYRLKINKYATPVDNILKQEPKVVQQQIPKITIDNISHKTYALHTDKRTLNKKATQTEIKEKIQTSSIRQPVHLQSNWSLIIILFGILFYAAIIKLKFGKKLKQYSKALFNYSQFYRLFCDQNANSIRLSRLLSILFTINMSLVLFYINLHFDWFEIDQNTGIVLLIIIGLISIYSFLFYSINTIISFVFEEKETISEYVYNIYFINRNFSFISIPFIVVYPFLDKPFSSICLYLVALIYLLLYVYRWFRGIRISFNNNVPIFYMILYPCILEIAPVILLYKWLFLRG